MDTAPQEDAPHGPSQLAVIAAQAPNAIATGAKNTSPTTMSTPMTRPRLISKASITDGWCGVKVRGPIRPKRENVAQRARAGKKSHGVRETTSHRDNGRI